MEWIDCIMISMHLGTCRGFKGIVVKAAQYCDFPTSSSMNNEVHPILIIGAGPVGLTMAILLRMQGIPIRLIETKTEYTTSSRGTAAQIRELELLSFIGVLDEVIEHSTEPYNMRLYSSDGITPLKDFQWSSSIDNDPTVPYTTLRTISQADLEAALRARLHSVGGKVELSTSLVNLVQLDNGVEAEISYTNGLDGEHTSTTSVFSFVVAADGAKGKS
ncbi:hypothetical protein D9757_011568 [Collybiopsis confluens]|uniref:FAD-binding domain-containing protein n=1 Tax=Collybiopsis confluens TaxID=2823264 RepID=A0A8H5LSU6_9AGAR|nr:hypothetical protein D9757_013010 [Collybiopsis confluens]KAF5368109.1 hypothetical protein D9757_011568 [Collybiopsis confluens]